MLLSARLTRRCARRLALDNDAASRALAQQLASSADGTAAAPPAKRARTAHIAPRSARRPLDDGALSDGVGFRLVHAHGGDSNAGAVQFEDLFREDTTSGALRWALLAGSDFDLERWLFEACPALAAVPVFLIANAKTRAEWEERHPPLHANVSVHLPELKDRYQRQHAKFSIAVHERSVRVAVHGANYAAGDWDNVTNAVWMQNFPLKAKASGARKISQFEEDLLGILCSMQWPGGGKGLNITALRAFDYSTARVALVASVPGAHKGQAMASYGHLRLRALLAQQHFAHKFIGLGSRLVAQVSSIATAPFAFMRDLQESLSAGGVVGSAVGLVGKPSELALIWPTMEEVRTSVDGWGVGGLLEGSHAQIVDQPGTLSRLHRWSGPLCLPDAEGRRRVIPHMKSFARYHASSGELAWFLTGSHNLCPGAWGSIGTDGNTLNLTAFELSVLFLPHLAGAGTTRLVATAAGGGTPAGLAGDALALRLPFSLPPVPYVHGAGNDQPWCKENALAYAPKLDAHDCMWSRNGAQGELVLRQLTAEEVYALS